MEVKDLIEALKECDQEKPVFIWEDHWVIIMSLRVNGLVTLT